MPTTATNTITGTQVTPAIKPELAAEISVKLKPSTTFAAGQVLGELTATPGTFAPYASGNADGSQNPRAILKRACITDASGNISYATTTGGAEWGITHLTADAWIGGYFFAQDLAGLDATAITNGLGSLRQGTVTSGIIRL